MNRRGFTLVELVTVVVIIGVLATIALPLVADARRRAEATRVIADANAVRVAAYSAFESDGAFPPNTGWGRVPPSFVPALPTGFSFTRGDVSYRWRRYGLPNGQPRNARQTEVIGLEVRASDERLIDAISSLFRGGTARETRSNIVIVLD